MRFYPESTEPEYKAESDVWDTIKEALKDEDGVAWHGYRLYRKGRSYSYAPDIFVLSRRYGAIVIECKV
jgi:Nuclease-related domain